MSESFMNIERVQTHVELELCGKYACTIRYSIEDHDFISRYKWWANSDGYVYAFLENRKRVSLSRYLMKCPPNMITDHDNRDRSDIEDIIFEI